MNRDLLAAYTGACYISHSRIGPTVEVGPFTTVADARAWLAERSPDTGWSIVLLQDPKHETTPDWN